MKTQPRILSQSNVDDLGGEFKISQSKCWRENFSQSNLNFQWRKFLFTFQKSSIEKKSKRQIQITDLFKNFLCVTYLELYISGANRIIFVDGDKQFCVCNLDWSSTEATTERRELHWECFQNDDVRNGAPSGRQGAGQPSRPHQSWSGVSPATIPALGRIGGSTELITWNIFSCQNVVDRPRVDMWRLCGDTVLLSC